MQSQDDVALRSQSDMSSTSGRNKILLNPYRDWAKGQGIPIYEGFGLDLLALETSRWDFTETNGALVHLAEPCRYYASALGSRRYPFDERKEAMYRGEEPKDKKIDGAQLEYAQQPADCHLAFLIEMENAASPHAWESTSMRPLTSGKSTD
jgi:hypothetical protein